MQDKRVYEYTDSSSIEKLGVEEVYECFEGVSNPREWVEFRCATRVGVERLVCFEQQMWREFERVFAFALQVESARPVRLLDAVQHNIVQFGEHAFAVWRSRVRTQYMFILLEIAFY